MTELSPVAVRDRIAVLDVWRGFALLGVVIVNFVHDNDDYLTPAGAAALATAGLDWRVANVVELLLANKFNTIFTLLFGMGVALMSERLAKAGEPVARVLLRRMLALLVIGWAHFLLLYSGELLHLYALGGIALIVVRRWPTPVLVVLGLACALLGRLLYEERPWLVTVVPEAWQWLLAPHPPGPGSDAAARYVELHSASPVELLLANARQALAVEGHVLRQFSAGVYYFGRMLLGYAFWRGGGARWLLAAAPATVLRLGLCLLGAAMAGLLSMRAVGPVPAGIGAHSVANLLRHATILVQAVAYLVLLLWLWRTRPDRPAWLPFQAVGRLSLSNYLLQSVALQLLIIGPGLRLGGNIGALLVTWLAVAVFVAQAMWSRHYLESRPHGPAERLWRWATYGPWTR